jgi:hypothetical protein
MKKHVLGAIGAALFAAVLVVLSVPVDAADVRCDIPFSFQVDETTLPPGAYHVSNLQGTLTILGLTRGAFTQTSGVSSKTAGYVSPKLVFHRYGDEYILRQVWTGGDSGRELRKSRREKQLAESKRTADFERVVIPIS